VRKRNVGAYIKAIKEATHKLNSDYTLGGFLGVYEWRKPVNENIENHENPKDYKFMTPNSSSYTPLITKTMKENSIRLLEQMKTIFNLDINQREQSISHNVLRLSDHEIISRGTVGFTRPLFIATDGSYDPEMNIARASIVIVEPDIDDHDQGEEWVNRKARSLLIRTYELPKSYGLESTTIISAEVVGLILASLTIPKAISNVIITDSNVAKATITKCMNLHELTPRNLIRNVGHHISNYLVNLMITCTCDWKDIPIIEMVDWATTVLKSWSTQREDNQGQQERAKFNKDMWTDLGRNFIMKIYSHQDIQKEQCPNVFCTSANEIADMAAKITQHIDMSWRDGSQI